MNFSFEKHGSCSPEALQQKALAILQAANEKGPQPADWAVIFSCIDHTSLDGTDSEESISDFTKKAKILGADLPGQPRIAAVCVYPLFAGTVSNILRDSVIKTACVAGAFPSAQSPLKIRLQEAAFALDNGADEIDMVISRGRMIKGDHAFVFDEISAFREVCGKALLKVILETGELKDPLLIARAGEIALRSGADFLKTSTGKSGVGSTPEALLVMMQCIRDYHQETGKKCGIKPSGGIAEPSAAFACLSIIRSVLGEDWLNPALFRIGASRLTAQLTALLKAV